MGYHMSDCKAFAYHKYRDRDEHVHLCRLVEMEQQANCTTCVVVQGGTSTDHLVRAIAHMALTWDTRAPTELTPEQKQEVPNHPKIARLRQRRDRHQRYLCSLGFHPLHTAAGNACYSRYEDLDRKLNSVTTTLTTTLKKQRLEKRFAAFTTPSTTVGRAAPCSSTRPMRCSSSRPSKR
ncbi:hypothetical protein A1O3_06123 [Capronia epimyces CBS 606.96]|uniref:Uncharacterized protein n=1 Tax=Capronia epimyces CBS 606.96 TaxID=1182542 RepID=W9XY45_9EURO|nr:uncharacterized protein A1O3_06123 [Capronia epimyces CBS 606.96]EXJ82310.1 hypothetical protein A1O3_06123 [Capronia epimyces CBS 606.96]